jgi:hypothetical protein
MNRAKKLLQESIAFRTTVVETIHREIRDQTRNHREEDDWWSTRAHRDGPVFSTVSTCGQRRYGVYIK